ncbi:kinesin-like protein KIF18A [Tiliqua scincoides]|uniref:kinesin-like protein KIF18A n=1 Tax=Tiliqua scincoides TaxID=71010 RepID=UPI0034624205
MSAVSHEDVCNHVKVVIRVRPENQKEKESSFSKVLDVVDKYILVFDPKVEEVSFFHGKKRQYRDLNKKQNKDLKFVFDAVFDENSTQLEVFEHTTKTVLDGFLNGYNCTVLAYGATGAGKTYTMLGSPEEPGVMYLTMMELYDSIDRMKEEKHCAIAVSYLEVYNEQIRDLLVSSGPLAVREDPQKGVVVQGLTLHQPKSAEEILQMLDYGNKNRTQHPTDVNASSSRSHAVFQIYLRQQDKTASINQNVRIAKMCLIDLAGSERASATKAKGARFREGANINRSLLALGNVINALADPKSKKQHIPYRNSKLTRLLKDSLGGNCRTIIIAAVSPSSMFYDDTYNTLKYANRAKDIKSSLKSNVVSLDSHISQYVKICEEQKREIVMLKEKLKAYEMEKMSVPENGNTGTLTNQQEEEILRFKEILKCVFANREEIRKEFLKLELRLKENALKTHYQKCCHEQIEMMCSPGRLEKATLKRDHRLALLKTRCLQMEKKKEDEMKHLEENTNWLHRVENEMRLLGQNGHVPQELCRDLKCYYLKLEVKDLKTQIECMRTLASLQEQQHKQTEKILNASLIILRKQYIALKNAGLANGVITDDFREFEQLIQREKAVVWADQMVEEEPQQNDQPKMSAIMAFPQLASNRNSPCRTSSGKVKTNVQLEAYCGVPPVKRTRRKLMDSPLAVKTPEQSSQPSPGQLLDSLSKALRPIVYTPEVCRKSKENWCPETVVKQVLCTASLQETNSGTVQIQESLKENSRKATEHNRTPECQMNSTITLYENITDSTDYPSSDVAENKSQSTNSGSVLQRLGLPSLLNRHPGPIHERPSYMAMTSAAERKRKLLSSNNGLTNQQDHVAAKRIRSDSILSNKPLRVPKATGNRTRSWKQPDGLRNRLKSSSKDNAAMVMKLRTSK